MGSTCLLRAPRPAARTSEFSAVHGNAMSLWNLIILLGAAAAALVPLGGRSESPVYLRWLIAIIATYLASVLYWDARAPYAEAFGFLCDCILVLAFVFAGKY